MNDGLIPQRYAKALYKYALEKKVADVVYDELLEVINSFSSNRELQKVISNPYVAKADKEKLLIAAAGKNVEEGYSSFVKLILESGREEYSLRMALAYRQIYRKANNISQVEIVTAAALGDKETKKLQNLVQQSCPDRKLEFKFTINPEIIGGFIVNLDSVRLDASISNEIEKLRLNLLRSN